MVIHGPLNKEFGFDVELCDGHVPSEDVKI
jgi:hypothetical protein